MPPGHSRVAAINRGKGRLRRYCSGCAHETEHVAWTVDGRGSIPSIRWPAAQPADGTTICVSCGHWRPRASGLALSRDQRGDHGIEESERWLRGHGHRPDPTRLTWLGEFYDEQSNEWRRSERDERQTDELLRRLRTRSASG
jgi:hypothetical protein